jgi:hypothetical protein
LLLTVQNTKKCPGKKKECGNNAKNPIFDYIFISENNRNHGTTLSSFLREMGLLIRRLFILVFFVSLTSPSMSILVSNISLPSCCARTTPSVYRRFSKKPGRLADADGVYSDLRFYSRD